MFELVPARCDAGFVPLIHYLGEPDAGVHDGVEAHPVEEPWVAVRRVGVEHEPDEPLPAPVEELHEIDGRVVQPSLGKVDNARQLERLGIEQQCPAAPGSCSCPAPAVMLVVTLNRGVVRVFVTRFRRR